MKRRTSTAPVKIYSYGLRLPTDGGDVIERQILNAHRYYNTLIEIERRRREKVRAAQSLSSSVIVGIESRIQVLSEAIEKGFGEISTKKGVARSNIVDVDAEKLALRVLRTKRQAALGELKQAKKDARTPELLENFATIGEEAKAEIKQARNICNVWWGTYLLVEQAVQAACKSRTDPEFHRWIREMAKLDDSGKIDDGGYDGRGCSGRVGVHIQDGLSVRQIFGENNYLQIKMEPTGSKRGETMAELMFRIGSTEKGKPIWSVFPFRMHRPLPADGIVKWAWISKSIKGRWVNWDLQITVEAESMRRVPRPQSAGGVVALDIGWRKRPEEDDTNLRVAYWVDDSGRQGELCIPSRIHKKLKHAESIRSIADKDFDAIRNRLAGWLSSTTSPDWLAKSIEYLAQWKTPRKLGFVIDTWKNARFDGDAEIYAELSAWWKQHRHLYDWESCERDRTLGARKMLYRRWAAEFTRRYAVVIIEDFDLSKIAWRQEPDAENKDLPKLVRRNRTIAACSEFRLALSNAAPGNGCTIALEPCADTTATCRNCGNVERFDHRPLVHTCERCGGETGPVDQDRNAAENLLAAWSGKVSRSQNTPEDPRIFDGYQGDVAKPAQGAVP